MPGLANRREAGATMAGTKGRFFQAGEPIDPADRRQKPSNPRRDINRNQKNQSDRKKTRNIFHQMRTGAAQTVSNLGHLGFLAFDVSLLFYIAPVVKNFLGTFLPRRKKSKRLAMIHKIQQNAASLASLGR